MFGVERRERRWLDPAGETNSQTKLRYRGNAPASNDNYCQRCHCSRAPLPRGLRNEVMAIRLNRFIDLRRLHSLWKGCIRKCRHRIQELDPETVDADWWKGREECSLNWQSLCRYCCLLNSHLKAPSCGRGWKMGLLKAENKQTRCWNKPDFHQSKVQAWHGGSVPIFLSSRTCFGISFFGWRI